jgi:hypothetical protein
VAEGKSKQYGNDGHAFEFPDSANIVNRHIDEVPVPSNNGILTEL